MRNFFFLKKNLGDWVSQKLIYNFYKSCKKIKVESKLVYGIITTDEKKKKYTPNLNLISF